MKKIIPLFLLFIYSSAFGTLYFDPTDLVLINATKNISCKMAEDISWYGTIQIEECVKSSIGCDKISVEGAKNLIKTYAELFQRCVDEWHSETALECSGAPGTNLKNCSRIQGVRLALVVGTDHLSIIEKLIPYSNLKEIHNLIRIWGTNSPLDIHPFVNIYQILGTDYEQMDADELRLEPHALAREMYSEFCVEKTNSCFNNKYISMRLFHEVMYSLQDKYLEVARKLIDKTAAEAVK